MEAFQDQLTAAGMGEVTTTVVACLLAAAIIAAATQPCRRQRGDKDNDDDTPRVAWEWFCVSNIVALAGFLGSVSYLLNYWMRHGNEDHGPAFAFMQPYFILSLSVAMCSLLYFFAFFGVAFVYKDVTEWMQKAESEAAAASAAREPRWAEADADVIIVGLGLAGSALATVLGRQGKRVLVIERCRTLYESIKGELLQPGGVRALERMGLAACAKADCVDPVRVDGYVCIRPGEGPGSEIVLSYPNRDPQGWLEYIGLSSPGGINANAKFASGTGQTEVIGDTWEDVHPRGRSFHNVRFVNELRREAEAAANVKIVWGSARGTVTCKDVARIRAAKGEAGSDTGMPAWTSDPDRVVGVTWVPVPEEGREEGAPRSSAPERMSLAPLTVVADGMYSVLRRDLHENAPRTVSHFCGLMLRHEPAATPLPHPNRGHVIMTDPNPVLFYQISSTETRVLVDVPASRYSDDSDVLRVYFRDVVAPQLPTCLQAPFLDACATQEPICMPNKALTGSAPTKKGVVMVGDTLNMRHPLTGGGMTVALKDVELLSQCISRTSMTPARYSEKGMEQAIARFSERRAAHASTINILANALHRVFSRPANDDGTRGRLREACINYLGLGGASSAGPVGLLSGLCPQPDVLIVHFFAVALHAMKRALLPFPSPRRLREGYDLLHIACIIIMPLLAAERVTILSHPVLAAAINVIFPFKNVDPATL